MDIDCLPFGIALPVHGALQGLREDPPAGAMCAMAIRLLLSSQPHAQLRHQGKALYTFSNEPCGLTNLCRSQPCQVHPPGQRGHCGDGHMHGRGSRESARRPRSYAAARRDAWSGGTGVIFVERLPYTTPAPSIPFTVDACIRQEHWSQPSRRSQGHQAVQAYVAVFTKRHACTPGRGDGTARAVGEQVRTSIWTTAQRMRTWAVFYVRVWLQICVGANQCAAARAARVRLVLPRNTVRRPLPSAAR